MRDKYQSTIYACFVGYVVQAIVNNFAPLLFLTFHNTYGIPLEKITFLITFNFGLQLLIDLGSVTFADKIGYRASMIIAHIMAVAGLVLMTILPERTSDPFAGLLISVIIYAIGGGLLEVLLSPIVEACQTENKEKAMSLLHAFYCWGYVGVVLISTIFFSVFGIQNWKIMVFLWALIPFFNMFAFFKVPIVPLVEEGEAGLSLKELFHIKLFWVLMMMMLCAGACEQAVAQWASILAESGLGVSKTIGDLAGPMLFALLMGCARTFYGKWGEKIELEKFMYASGILCVISYLIIAFVPVPALGLAGCALCGLSVGILWPGAFSMASASIKNGGTAMFAMLALAGDLGCSGGPTVAGTMAGLLGDNLRMGVLAAIIFPVLLLISLKLRKKLWRADI